jgi:hypothetical protein
MTQMPVITIERRRYAALIEALKLARYAMLRSGRRFDYSPHVMLLSARKREPPSERLMSSGNGPPALFRRYGG